MKQRKTVDRRALSVEGLEERRVLAVSVGWDGPGTGSAKLSYYIGQAPGGISQSTFETAVETALKSWSDVAAITFVQTTQPGLNNSLDFTSQSIDGSGGTLAQAYFPSDVNRGRLAGDVEFDAAEKWEVGNSLGSTAFDLVLVAAHEIGHALGLDHSNSPSAVLYPSVSPSQSFKGLAAADISAIRALYAAAPGSTNTNTTNTNTTNPNSTNTGTTPTGTTNTGGTHNWIPRTPRSTFNSWFANHSWIANWYSQFGRLTSGVEQLVATVPTNTNLSNPLDVNLDDTVSPIDALIVINLLNDHGPLSIETNYRCDTNGDGQVSPVDALIVINGLGEKNQNTPSSLAPAVHDPLINTHKELVDASNTDGTTSTDTTADTDGTDAGPDMTDSGDDSDSGDDDATGDDSTPDGSTTDDSDASTDTDMDSDSDTENDSDTDEPNNPPRHFGNGHGGFGFGFPIALGGGLTPERVDRLFKNFDDNADELLTEDEVPSRLWTRWVDDRVDTNDDSSISPGEVNAAIRAVQQEKFDALDTDSNGLLSKTEVSARLWTKLTDAKADTNTDGGISFDELIAFQAAASTGSGCDHGGTSETDSTSTTLVSNVLRQSGFAAQFASAIRGAEIPRIAPKGTHFVAERREPSGI